MTGQCKVIYDCGQCKVMYYCGQCKVIMTVVNVG